MLTVATGLNDNDDAYVAGTDEMLIRDPISVDENGSITCAVEIPEDADIQLMLGSRDEAVRVAEEAARNAVEQCNPAFHNETVVLFLLAQ